MIGRSEIRSQAGLQEAGNQAIELDDGMAQLYDQVQSVRQGERASEILTLQVTAAGNVSR
jgi:hypothetical protein